MFQQLLHSTRGCLSPGGVQQTDTVTLLCTTMFTHFLRGPGTRTLRAMKASLRTLSHNQLPTAVIMKKNMLPWHWLIKGVVS